MSSNANPSPERETRNAELNRRMDEAGFPTLDEMAQAQEHGRQIPWPPEHQEGER